MARRNKAGSVILGVSIGVHAALGAVVVLLPADKVREVVAIAFADAPPPKRAQPARAKPADPGRSSRALAARMRSAAAAARAAAAAPESSAPSFTDLGLSLDSSSSDGLAVPVAPRPAPAPAARVKSQPKLLVATSHTANCTDPLVKPVVQQLARPEYTDQAVAAKVEGRIRLELTVDELGAVSGARVLEGLGYGLDEAAIAAAQRIRFRPATRCSRPVAAPFVLAMRFVLSS